MLPRVLVTVLAVAAAVAAGWLLWQTYVESPWTRDGRVRANVVQIAPDVSGVITEVRVRDNQQVARGEVLMVIDPERFRLAVAQAEARLRAADSAREQRQRELERRVQLTSSAISNETREQAATAAREADAAYDEAVAALDIARLNLERSELRSTVNGFVTNLLVQAGEYAQDGKALVAVVDQDSFYVAAYFEETKLARIRLGEPATIRLMSRSEPLSGRVESITRAIADRENTAGSDLIANVNPTFAWVRLPQRIPVRIAFEALPADIELTSGMTATVVIHP
ncbi:MAG: efflux RND transporter periplasmic adaptor subunit [Geminicoccaceae bacterium]